MGLVSAYPCDIRRTHGCRKGISTVTKVINMADYNRCL